MTNGKQMFVDGDGRSPWARRWKDLCELHARDISPNGAIHLSEAQRSLIRRTATIEIELEAVEGKLSEGNREQALRLREKLKVFVEMLVETGAAFTDGAAAWHAAREALSEIHNLGASAPSHEQFSVLTTKAVETILMSAPGGTRAFRHLAPNERKRADELARGWAEMIEANFIRPRLGEAEPAEAA